MAGNQNPGAVTHKQVGYQKCRGPPWGARGPCPTLGIFPTLGIYAGRTSPHNVWLWKSAGLNYKSFENEQSLTPEEPEGYRTEIPLLKEPVHYSIHSNTQQMGKCSKSTWALHEGNFLLTVGHVPEGQESEGTYLGMELMMSTIILDPLQPT